MTNEPEAQKQEGPAGAVQLDERQLERARGGVLSTQNAAQNAAQKVAQKVNVASAVSLGDGSVRPVVKAGDGSV
jgi:hypothetical protein